MCLVKTHRSGHMRPTCFTICKLCSSRRRFHDSCANEKKQMKIVCVTFLEILLQTYLENLVMRREEEFTVSIRWRYFLFVYIFCLFVFMAVVLY